VLTSRADFTKAVFTFLATSYANGVMANIGPGAVFNYITCINLGICALTIPAYVFGKRFRSYVSSRWAVFLMMIFVLTGVNRLQEVRSGRRFRARCV
jgi:hypothetical protein